MALKRRASREGVGADVLNTINVGIIRPPGVPSIEKHQINLATCGLGTSALAAWLGCSVQDIETGENIMVRVAVSYYCDWRARAILSRAGSLS